ncbi:hypothetical protein [Chryseobacterium sp. EO14]|uniref:hypothetical protein n=1 Tax=Chryseobacterium sp. EO14 TaxID=2950551 RepID=UPI00210BDDF3|nr:hypothetical protein [Chryseobacterium sp. EO14]MCQ4139223.1 hypothetical protein [Chryseobacterium sp. EO14]
MKKVLFIFALSAMVACSSSSDDDNSLNNTSQTSNQGSGIGTVNFTFKGKSYSYTNYNYRDGGLIATNLIDETKPSLFWGYGTSSTSISSILKSGNVNNQPYNENTITLSLVKQTGSQPVTAITVYKGNGTATETTFCANPQITYTTDSNNRISGTFTSTECSGTFSNIVKGN